MRIAGHPLHPMLVHFPIAAWTGAVVADLARWIWQLPMLAIVGYGCEAAGVVTGALAMVAGFIDYAAIPSAHPAQGAATNHMMVMGVAWALFLMALVVRHLAVMPSALIWASVLDVGGFIALLIGAQMGGTLVYRFRVGTREPG